MDNNTQQGDLLDQVAAEQSVTQQPTQASPSQPQPPSQPAPSGDLLDQVAAEHQPVQQQQAAVNAEPEHGSTYNYLHGVYENTLKPVADLPGDLLKYYYVKADEAGGTGTVAGNVNALAHVSAPVTGTVLDMLDKLRTHPKEPSQVLKDALKDPEHPITKIVSGIIQSHAQTAAKAWENQKAALAATRQAIAAARNGDFAAADAAAQQADLYQMETFGYAGATALPVLGPAAANAGEDIGEGRVAEGLGKGTGLVGSVLAPHAPEAARGLPDTVSHVYDATLGKVIPREQLPIRMKEPSVYNPEAGNATPVSEVSPEGNRAVTGSHVQDIAERVKNRAGAEAGAAAKAAKAMPIAEAASDEFVSDVKKWSEEAKGLSIDRADEFSKIQRMSDDLAKNPPQTHVEFDQAKARISAKLDEESLTPQQTRLYSGLRQTLQDEYYGRVADVDPKLSNDLKAANTEYHDQITRLTEGPAKTLFDKNAPEDVIKNLASQGAKESAAHDIMQSMHEADALDVTNDASGDVAPKGYVRAVRNGVLKQQMEEFATRRNADGNPTQVDARKWLNRFEKNQAVNKEIFGVDDYRQIHDSLKEAAQRQYRVERNRSIAMKVAIGGASSALLGGVLKYILGNSPAPTVTSEPQQ